jgi:FAD/FMN-containing dehydrogenase
VHAALTVSLRHHGRVSDATPPDLLDALRAIVGEAHVLVTDDVTVPYTTDWTGRFVGHGLAVVRPENTSEVSAIVALCNEERVAIVPQGGNTGLVGGGVPLRGELVLSLRRIDQLEPVDPTAMNVVVGAGATIGSVQAHALDAGLAYAVDLAARDSATVGGTIATNAGGLHLLRWGGTRQQLLGVEAVVADGSIVTHLDGLPKDNTGYHLASLLCGSEGTLGVVTKARLRLVPRFEQRVVALVAFDDIEVAVTAVGSWRRRLSCLDAAEVFFDEGLALVCRVDQVARPFEQSYPVYVLVEAADHHDPTDALASLVGDTPGVGDVAVGTDAHRRDALWHYREGHTMAINTLGAPHKLDVTLPLSRLAEFIHDVRALIGEIEPDASTWLFGHIGDGNIHVNVTGLAPDDDRVDAAVLELVAERGGSISAEHGIGTAKKQWLHLNRSPEELRAFRAIKTGLDPNGILNPNVLLP